MSTMEPDEGTGPDDRQGDAPRWEKTAAAGEPEAPRWEGAEGAEGAGEAEAPRWEGADADTDDADTDDSDRTDT